MCMCTLSVYKALTWAMRLFCKVFELNQSFVYFQLLYLLGPYRKLYQMVSLSIIALMHLSYLVSNLDLRPRELMVIIFVLSGSCRRHRGMEALGCLQEPQRLGGIGKLVHT